MSTFKHTPGPWEASDDVILCAAPDMAIGSVFPCDRDKSAYGTGFTYGEVTKANARLIAAAPELLEALQLLLDAEYSDLVTIDELGRAEAAIAKATQEPQA